MIPIDVSRAWAERAVGVQAWARSIGIESMHAAGGWYPKLPGFDSIEVYGPMPRGVDPATADYTLPAPGELAFKGPVPFGNGQTLHDQLVEARSEEHTSELQSLMRNSYAVVCLQKKNNTLLGLDYQ